jgi:hypothetical protein
MQQLYDTLSQRFSLGEFTRQRADLAFITVEAVRLHALLRHLRDQEGFTHLVLLTAVGLAGRRAISAHLPAEQSQQVSGFGLAGIDCPR